MKSIVSLLLLLLLISGLMAQSDPYLPDATTPPAFDGMQLIWNDEFNVNGAPNTANWKPETGFVRNQELQYYQLKNATCTSGVLLLTAKRDTVVNSKYVRGSTDWRYKDSLAYWTSASLITQGLRTFQYGRIDVRARIDTTYGAWPAIWQKGITGSWPACGEVDIMEFYNKKVYANAIYGAVGAPNYSKCVSKSITTVTNGDSNWAKKFHLWTEIWTADSLKLYLDGVLMNQVLVSAIANPAGTSPANGFQQQHFFLLNLAVGSNGGTPRAKTKQITYEVDYIRVYQKMNTAVSDVISPGVYVSYYAPGNVLKIFTESDIKQITILDVSGRIVKSIQNPEKSIPLHYLKKGYYIAHLTSTENEISNMPFLIN